MFLCISWGSIMLKIYKSLLCITCVFCLIGCTHNSTDTQKTNPIEEKNNDLEDDNLKLDFSTTSDDFFNVAFCKDDSGNIYFPYGEKIYKTNSNEDFLEVFFDQEGMVYKSIKYYNNHIYFSYVNPPYGPGIAKINMTGTDFIKFETPNYFPSCLYLMNNKIYADVEINLDRAIDEDSDEGVISFDIDNQNGDLSNFQSYKSKSLRFRKSEYIKNKYPDLSYENELLMKGSIANCDKNNNIYFINQGNINDIFRLNLKTNQKGYFSVNDHLSTVRPHLDIVDDKVYTVSYYGAVSFDMEFENMKYIIKDDFFNKE